MNKKYFIKTPPQKIPFSLLVIIKKTALLPLVRNHCNILPQIIYYDIC